MYLSISTPPISLAAPQSRWAIWMDRTGEGSQPSPHTESGDASANSVHGPRNSWRKWDADQVTAVTERTARVMAW